MKPLNILTFFRTVADRSPLPVLIYNFPQATGYDVPVEVVVQLADHPNIVGIKESSGDVEKVAVKTLCKPDMSLSIVVEQEDPDWMPFRFVIIESEFV